MATITNARDVLLQAASPRLVSVTLPDNIVVPAVKAVVLTAPSLVFQVATSGTASPASITLTAELKHLTGTISWAVTSGTATLTGSGSTRSLAYADLASNSATITASVTEGATTYQASLTIAKVRDGTNGTPGQRGNTRTTRTDAALSAWSDAAANAAITDLGYTVVLMDEVTLRNAATSPTYIETRYWSGSAWATIGQVIDGNLLVTGTITSDKIGTNTLTAVNVNTSGQIRSTGSYSVTNYSGFKASVAGENNTNAASEMGLFGYGYNGVIGFTLRNDGLGAALKGITQSAAGTGLSFMGKMVWDNLTGPSGIYTWAAPDGSGKFLKDNGTWATPASGPSLASTTPSALGTAAVGTGTTAARADHVHAMPTAADVGAARADHVHAMPTAADVGAATSGHLHTGVYAPAHASAYYGNTALLSAGVLSRAGASGSEGSNRIYFAYDGASVAMFVDATFIKYL